eukprot:5053647-Pleurochrysis_carterae.AAC.1
MRDPREEYPKRRDRRGTVERHIELHITRLHDDRRDSRSSHEERRFPPGFLNDQLDLRGARDDQRDLRSARDEQCDRRCSRDEQ